MQNRLQELTNKLYSEGLSKGKEEALEIVSKAKAEAEEIKAKAEREYKERLERAKRDAEELRSNVESEIKMASRQSLATIKQKIEGTIVTKAIKPTVTEVMNDRSFFAEIIKAAVASFNPDEHSKDSLEVLLPQDKKEELKEVVEKLSQQLLDKGVGISFDSKTREGFQILSKEEGYAISFTDEQFTALIAQYVQPTIQQFLFEE